MKLILCAFALVSTLALAGKAEREYRTKTLDPAIKEAQTAYKTNCGCDLKVVINDSLGTEDLMGKARYVMQYITEDSKKYCTDKESKAAVCKMKVLELTKGNDSTFTFSGNKGVATTDGQSTISFDMITAQLDK